MLSLDRKVAIVTGGAKGIGFEISKLLASLGGTVVIADINGGEAAVDKLKGEGLEVIYHRCDVSSDTDTSALVDSVVGKYGRIDILVNNAGILSTGALDSVGSLAWDRLFAVNVKSVFLLATKAATSMRERRWGRIINIASVAGQVGGGFLGNSCYAASKGAVISLTKGLARELGEYSITANVICPGFITTELTGQLTSGQHTAALAAIPLGTPGAASDVASAVAFLASDNSAYVSGVTMNVDGALVRY